MLNSSASCKANAFSGLLADHLGNQIREGRQKAFAI
jgi:hypothetical protein